jgi:hypothetical protein
MAILTNGCNGSHKIFKIIVKMHLLVILGITKPVDYLYTLCLFNDDC